MPEQVKGTVLKTVFRDERLVGSKFKESGTVDERLKSTVLKTVAPAQGAVGSNPASSARVRKISDVVLLWEYLSNGLSIFAIKTKYGMCATTVERRLNRLTRDGKIPGGFMSSKATARLVETQTLVNFYRSGLGVRAIAKRVGLGEHSVWERLMKVGSLDTSRQFLPSGKPRRSRRLKSYEFLNSTRRLRFTQVKGACEHCHKQISPEDPTNWRLATYHHNKKLGEPPTRDIKFCVVVHRTCHEQNFQELHGFPRDKLLMGYIKAQSQEFGFKPNLRKL